jgi:hypothetical protein
MRAILAGVVILTGLSGAARAAIIGSGPAHGGNTQSVAVCYIFNQGRIPITVSSIQIIAESVGILGVVSNDCSLTFPLISGEICRTVSNISPRFVLACRATVSKGTARGRLEIRDAAGNTLTSETLRKAGAVTSLAPALTGAPSRRARPDV